MPPKEEWRSKVMNYAELAKLTAKVRDESFVEEWKPFLDYLKKCYMMNTQAGFEL